VTNKTNKQPCFIDTCQHWTLWMCKEAVFVGSKTSQKVSFKQVYKVPIFFQISKCLSSSVKNLGYFLPSFPSSPSSGNLSRVDLSTTYRLTSDVQVCHGTRVVFSQDVGIQPFG